MHKRSQVASMRKDGSAERLAIEAISGHPFALSNDEPRCGGGRNRAHILTDQTDLIKHDDRLGKRRNR